MAENIEIKEDSYREELFEKFYNSLPESFKPTNIYTQIRSAYDFAYSAHYGVARKSGEPYITHPVSVALIVANEIGLGVSSVVAALLHDVVEDTEYTRDDIAKLFGESVATIVDGVTKITDPCGAMQNAQAETFKKMLLWISQDSRVVFIKIADRIHNMRTMSEMPDGTRQIKAGENFYIFIPIADQLGLYDLKNELEDTSFKYSLPSKYQHVSDAIKKGYQARQELLSNFSMSLMRVLVRTGITCRLSMVKKSLYQIFLQQGDSALDMLDIANIEAVRIIFDLDSDADTQEMVGKHYSIYAAVINIFLEREGYKRDYVVKPKKNGFQALVFQVMYEGYWIEVQVLTTEADMVAHRGYSFRKPNRIGLDYLKDNLRSFDKDYDAVALLNRIRSMSSLQTIFVFTPKGSLIELPQGSTVLDFAYAIHTRVGNHCMGAYVGQRLVPINYELNSTDKVTVLTSPSIRPNTSWMQYVRSDYAKTYLDKYFRHDSRSDNSDIETGKKMFNNILCDNRVIAGPILLGKILSHYKLPNNEELYKRIARYDISQDDLLQCISKIKQNSRAALKNDAGNRVVKKEDKLKYASVIINYKKPIQIDNSISFVAPSCCQPIPGDEALAFVDKDNILFVHRRVCIHAKELTATNGKKTTKVVWADNMEPMLAALRIEGLDRNGIILDIAKLLDKWNINIKLLKISENDGLFTGDIHVMIKNLRELERLSDQISEIQNVVSCKRINPNGEYFNIISDKQR